MNPSGKPATLRWDGGVDGHLVVLDQTRLPNEVVELHCHTVEDVWQAIKRLSVRGAPAIGVAAAYGACLALNRGPKPEGSVAEVIAACDYLATSRPTAVNLFWALNRMRQVAERARELPPEELAAALLAEAHAIRLEDEQTASAIGRHGADLLADFPKGGGILTHCNAGALVTTGVGTALAIVYELTRRGKQPHVWVDETRPLLQGARLTAWELMQHGVDCTLICDSMAAQVMREGRVQAVTTGADRIAGNGDVANKIGTYGVALLAKAHDIPFYVAAPTNTFDPTIETGGQIPIEQRAGEEIACCFGTRTAPEGMEIYNPAFDVTPAALIRAIITERGAIEPVKRSTVATSLSAPGYARR